MADSWIRVIILEDHPMMRETLEARLVTHSDDMLVLYAGPSIEDAQVLAARSDVHCVILDLDLGDIFCFSSVNNIGFDIRRVVVIEIGLSTLNDH